MTSSRSGWRRLALAAAMACVGAAPALAQSPQRPNILVIMADDVGYANVGIYSHGMMVPTPSIDRIGREGILFTDHYAQPSCTAGRAAFITGQLPIRTGMHTVGLPGSPVGIDQRDPTLAKLLKELGYRTGQFGKNHLGDRNEHLPTVNGFDEFYGNLYHLNTEEEPSCACGARTRASTPVIARAACSTRWPRMWMTRRSTRGSARSASSGSRTPGR